MARVCRPAREEAVTNVRPDVPAADVGQIVQHYIDDGAAKIAVRREADGTWTVTATYP